MSRLLEGVTLLLFAQAALADVGPKPRADAEHADYVAALEERPKVPKARALVERYVALGEAQVSGKLTAGTYRIEFGSWEHGTGRKRLDANLLRAKELLGAK